MCMCMCMYMYTYMYRCAHLPPGPEAEQRCKLLNDVSERGLLPASNPRIRFRSTFHGSFLVFRFVFLRVPLSGYNIGHLPLGYYLRISLVCLLVFEKVLYVRLPCSARSTLAYITPWVKRHSWGGEAKGFEVFSKPQLVLGRCCRNQGFC